MKLLPLSGTVAFALLGLAGASHLGCTTDDEDLPLAPSDCVSTKPEVGSFEVKATVNNQHPAVPITIFLGDIETDAIVLRDTLTSAIRTYELPADERYSATALYVVGRDTILVVDADDISTNRKEYRDTYCWDVRAGEADLQLHSR